MKTTVNNIAVEIQEGWFVIESNHGNHFGYNRTWKQWNQQYSTKAFACRDMANRVNELNQARRGERGYTRVNEDSASHDLRYFMVVNAKELVETIQGTGTNLANIHAITVIED